jgi:hypothetical protein
MKRYRYGNATMCQTSCYNDETACFRKVLVRISAEELTKRIVPADTFGYFLQWWNSALDTSRLRPLQRQTESS